MAASTLASEAGISTALPRCHLPLPVNAAIAVLDDSSFSSHRPLNKENQEIRLLTLQDGPDDLPICLTLDYVPLLVAADAFIAFSYCWGAPDKNAEVVVNGRSVSIRHNLWLFLQNFRALPGRRGNRLWIDYLCIDQSNEDERGHQVRLMKDVFSNASAVYAWLGEATPETDLAIYYINLVSPIHRKQRSKTIPQAQRRSGVQALKDLVRREYWSRLWIVQELVLARKISLLVGDRVIQWDHLQAAATEELTPDAPVGKQGHARAASRKNFRSIWELRKDPEFTRGEPVSVGTLLPLLTRFRYAQCQDPRDRIFGLLGLASVTVRENAVVDYISSVIDVCIANMKLFDDSWRTDLSLDASKLWHVLSCVVQDHAALVKGSITSQLTVPLILETKLPLYSVTFSTIALYDAITGKFKNLDQQDRDTPISLYLTQMDAFPPGLHHDNGARPRILLSRTHCRDWDFILQVDKSLDAIIYLIVMLSGNSYQVVDVAVSPWGFWFKGTISFHSGGAPWLKHEWPKIRSSLVGYPSKVRKKNTDEASWAVELGPNANAELFKIWTLFDGQFRRNNDTEIEQRQGDCPRKWYDPRLLFPFLFGDEKRLGQTSGVSDLGLSPAEPEGLICIESGLSPAELEEIELMCEVTAYLDDDPWNFC